MIFYENLGPVVQSVFSLTSSLRVISLTILAESVRGMFEMNCLLSSSSISTWGTIKTNTYLYRAIQYMYLHNGV